MILQRPAVNCCTAQQKVPHGHAAKETTGFCSVVGTGLLVIFFTGFAWSHIGIAMIVFMGRKKNRLVLFKNKYYLSLADPHLHLPKHKLYRPSLNKNMWMILKETCHDLLRRPAPPPRASYSSTGHGCLRHVGNPLLHCSKLQTAHKNIGSGFAKPLQFFGFFLPLVIGRWFQEQEYTAMG